MNDPLIQEAREHIEAEIYRLFKTVAPTDVEALSQIKAMQYMHAKYEAFFKDVVNTGKMAKMELERRKKPLLQRIKEF